MTSHSVFTGNPLLDHWIMLEQSKGVIMVDHSIARSCSIMIDQVNPFDPSFDHRVPSIRS